MHYLIVVIIGEDSRVTKDCIKACKAVYRVYVFASR